MCETWYFGYHFPHFFEIFFLSSDPFPFRFFPNSCLIQSVLSENSCINLAIYCIAPRKGFNSLLDFRGFIWKMGLTFSLSDLFRVRLFRVTAKFFLGE